MVTQTKGVSLTQCGQQRSEFHLREMSKFSQIELITFVKKKKRINYFNPQFLAQLIKIPKLLGQIT